MTSDNHKALSLEDFEGVVRNAPLFSIDLVVLDDRNNVLLGKRLNAPAQNCWFVPGGRVFKGEGLDAAFKRISQAELGSVFERPDAAFLGLYDHMYRDSFFSDEVSTHYINAAYAVQVGTRDLVLPRSQHGGYRWVAHDELELDQAVHDYSKVFLPDLRKWLGVGSSD